MNAAVQRSRWQIFAPWSVDDPDMKICQDCHIVRDANDQALFEEQARPARAPTH
jgi:hypothetical protein